MTATTIHAAGIAAVAGVFGGMVFFAFVYAPLVLARHRGRWTAASALAAISGKLRPRLHGCQIHIHPRS